MSGLALFFLLILAGFAVVLPVLFMARPLKVPPMDAIKVDSVTSVTGDIKIIDRTGRGVSVRNAKAPGNIVAISTNIDDDPVLNPASPLSPLNPVNQMTADTHTSSHSHSQSSSHSSHNHDTTSGYHSSSSHEHSSSHSSHDYGSSYGGDSYGGGHDHGGGGDFGGGHHD